MAETKYDGYSKTAAVVVHPIEDAENYVVLVDDINPVHRQDECAVQAYKLLTDDITVRRKGDFLRDRNRLAKDKPNKRIMQGLYTANISTIDLLPPELRTNVIGHTCMFASPWLNSGDGETITTEVTYRDTYPTKVGDREIQIHAFQISKTIRELPEWHLREIFSNLDVKSVERIVKGLENIDLIFNGYIFASGDPIDFTNVKTTEEPYDRRTKISIDSETLVNLILNEKEIRKTPYVKNATSQLSTGRNPSLVLTDLLKEMVADEDIINRKYGSVVARTFNFGRDEFDEYNKSLKLDPNSPLSFDYFESRICGVALELANRMDLFKDSFMVYASQNFKANGEISLNLEGLPRTFSIIGIAPEPKENVYNLECAVLLGDKLLGIGTTSGNLIGGEEAVNTKNLITKFISRLRAS